MLAQMLAQRSAQRSAQMLAQRSVQRSAHMLAQMLACCFFLIFLSASEKLFRLLEDFCAAQQASGGSHVDLFHFIWTNIGPSRSQL